MTAIEELADDDRRWSGSRLPSCHVCQTPLPRADAVGYWGEVAHHSCALSVVIAEEDERRAHRR